MKISNNLSVAFLNILLSFNNIYKYGFYDPRYRDRVPTLQDFMDKDFEIKQINDNILSAKLKINRVDTEIKNKWKD